MKALITGCSGFLGSHLADLLLSEGLEVYGTYRSDKGHIPKGAKPIKLDMTSRKDVEKTVMDVQPDFIFHMAAQAYVMHSWKNQEETYRTNIFGTLYLLEAARKLPNSPVVSVACSSAAYGLTHPNEIPIKETREFRPSSPYAVSKGVQDMLAFLYWRTYGMKMLRLRFFNTVGPRKVGSAVADWAKAIAEIEAGLRKELGVGDLSTTVDLTDGRDSANAMWLLARKGRWGEAYNICSGKGNKMQDVLEKMMSFAKVKVNIIKDPAKIRPVEDPVFVGDNSKLKALGWKQKYSLEQTLQDTIDWWRAKIRPSLALGTFS